MVSLFQKKSPKDLAVEIKDKSEVVESHGDLSVYEIPLDFSEKFKVKGCNYASFGKKNNKKNRTIMVLGATGAGKTTLLNGMINYILGVNLKDSYRFKLVCEDNSKSQAESQTSEVTVYKLYHHDGFKIDYNLTIVDTPGFGDTRGIQRDMEITEQIRKLFSDPHQGVQEIDAICFVAQASLARLTSSQRYVFDSVLSIFGNDVAENIQILVTFADGQPAPVLQAITASGVPCPKNKKGQPIHFKFNNSALFASNQSSKVDSPDDDDDGDGDDGDSFDKMFWDMGRKSMERFFKALNITATRSLTLTKEVLQERKRLENTIENLQGQIVIQISKTEQIRHTTEQLKTFEAEIARSKDFKIKTTYTEAYQIDNSGAGTFLTNCQQCNHTCHDTCGYGNDADKHKCCAIGLDGYCTVCPKHCHWSVHFNQKYKWGYREVTKEETIEELQNNFLKATQEKMPLEAFCDELKRQFRCLQDEIMELVESSAECLTRIKAIALKPSPLTTPDYIDMLIEGEKSEKKPGFRKRIASLMEMRKKAETISKLEKREVVLPTI